MSTSFKINDELSVNIPSGWHELKLRHYIAIEGMEKSDSDFENKFMLLSILSDLEMDTWLNVELNKINVEQLNESIAWINKKVHWKKFPKPEQIIIDDKKLRVPVDLQLERVGQHVDFEKRVYPLVKFNEDGSLHSIPAAAYPIALAIYLQPQYLGGDYSADDLEEMIELCKEAPFIESVSCANFFFEESLRLTTSERTIQYPEDEELSAAGIDRFNKFGFHNIVHAMAKAFSTTYQAIYQWSWADVFAYRVMRLEEYLFDKKLANIRSKKKT